MSLVAFIIFLGKIDDLVSLCGILETTRKSSAVQFSSVQLFHGPNPRNQQFNLWANPIEVGKL